MGQPRTLPNTRKPLVFSGLLFALLLSYQAHADSDLVGIEAVQDQVSISRPDPAPRAERIRAESEVLVHDRVDAEREHLANLVQELTYLRQQVADAAKQAPGAARVQFRYDWLDRDIELIQRAIQEHLDAPREPRPVPPLKGNYRR